MIWIRLFAFSVIAVVFRSCYGYSVKKSINAESSRVYGIVNDAKNREAMIGNVLENYVKPFKRLSANFPGHDVEIQLEFQRPMIQQASKIIQKRPIYKESHKRPKIHALHEKGHSGIDYIVESNANEHYAVPSHHTVEYLPLDNVAGHNAMDQFVSRGVIDNYGARKIIGRLRDNFGLHNGMESFGNHNGMVNFDGRNDMSNFAGHNTVMDNFSSRNSLGNNAGYSAMNNFGGHNAVEYFAGQNAMNMNYAGVYPMNHGVSNVIGQESVPVAPMVPYKGKGVPPVARQAETESTTTEAPVTTTNENNTTNENKGPPLSLEDIRRLFDEYAEKIISSKSGNEQQRLDNDQVPQVYIQDNNGQLDDSMLSNLDNIANLIKKESGNEQQRLDNDQVPQVYIQDNNGQLDDSMLSNLDNIANLIKRGVQVHKVDENNQEGFLPKTGLNWMRIKVPV